jgi:DNA-binding SARP family transcriptional activator/class 3 adenylate cyclase/WD40 repeat protein/KaiC/GvpD/RAD55 family RecA-like ATPase
MAVKRPSPDETTHDARTLAVVVSDIVGSTALRTRMGETAFTTLREAHDALAADLVEAGGGRIVRFTGDGLLVAFGSASQALDYASKLLPGVERLGDDEGRLVVRAGISLGDSIDVAGDLDGPALVEASRLCDAAAAGQVLCTELVRRASRADDAAFGDAIILQLKGLGDVDARELLPRVTDRVPTGFTVEVLGQLRATRAGRVLDIGGTKEQRVLAVLAAARGDVVLVDELVEALWSTSPPRTAERSVHAYVARLRKAVEPSRERGAPPRVIVTEGRGYRLILEPDFLDSLRFERLTSVARDSIAAGRALRARRALDEALSLWRGTPFQDHFDAERCARESRRLEHLHELAIEDLTSVRLELGDAADLVPDLEALVALHPLREQLWANLMLALYRSGRQAEALRTFQRARAVLVDELGIDPGPELNHLEARILAQDPTLLSAAPGVSGPSRGLPVELEYGGTKLVGREDELAQLQAAWERAFAGTGEFVAVVGREGSGKTRLVSELALHASDAGAIVMYARCDAADQSPEAPLDRALRGAGAQLSDVGREPGETQGAAVARFLSTWASGRPVLLVLDDFQLADTATVQALADLAEWSVSAPLLVVAMFRPDDGELGGSGRGRIALGPLARDAVVEIARGYRSRWTDGEIDELVAASRGVPLAVHRYASEWAQDATRREVRAAAERASEARVRLVASRGELADGIEGLQRLIEHRQLQLASLSSAADGLRVPYRGLQAFGSDDADLYFGREELVAELVTRVASAPLVLVVGASGSGKSSLVSAGLLPALETGVVWDAGTWSATTTVPGRQPAATLEAMRRAPSAPGHEVVVVDQLEELWTSTNDSELQQEFCDHLVALARDQDVTLVLCIRADFVDRIADHAPLAALAGANTLLVPPMTSDELRHVVEGPARRTGLQVEPQLVEAVVADVYGRPGALPLLSMALLATWERREGRTLTLRAYRAAGGVASAVAAVAEASFGALTSGAQRAARRLLLQLAGEEHGTDVRRRVPIVAIGADDAETREALDRLVARRLVIVDEDVAEVAHEALFRDWPRLAAWLDEDREARRVHERLTGAAAGWAERGRDPGELARGTWLDSIAEWAHEHRGDVAPLEREYLDASRAIASRELEEARARVVIETRRTRRLRTSLVGVAVLLVVALVAGGLAIQQGSNARESESRAELAARLRDASNLAARSRTVPARDYAIRLRLALEAYRLAPGPDSEGALESALVAVPRDRSNTVALPLYASVLSSITPDGTRMVVAGGSGADIRDAATGKLVRKIALPNHPAPAMAAVSGDGRWAVVGSNGGGVVSVFDIQSGQIVAGPLKAAGLLLGLAFDPTDRHRMFVGGQDGSITLWNLSSRSDPRARTVARVAPVKNQQIPLFVDVSDDGSRLFVGEGNTDPAVEIQSAVLDVRTGTTLLTVRGGFGAMSGDGRYVSTVRNGALTITEVDTGSTVNVPTPAVKSPFPRMSFDPQGVRLALTDGDTNRVHVIDWRSGQEVTDPIDIFATFTFAEFLPDGRLFVQNGQRAIVEDLAAAAAPALVELPGSRQMPWAADISWMSFTVDGRIAAVSNTAWTAWDARSLSVDSRSSIPNVGDDARVISSPDGRRLSIAHFEPGGARIEVVERRTGRVLGAADLSYQNHVYAAMSPDSSAQALLTGDGQIAVLGVGRDAGKLRLLDHDPKFPAVGPFAWFSPDGERLLVVRKRTAATSPRATVFDVASGRSRDLEVPPNASQLMAAWSPDGKVVALAATDLRSRSSTVALVDTSTGKLFDNSITVENATFPAIGFAQSGRRVVTLARSPDGPGSIRIWDVDGLLPIGDPIPVDPNIGFVGVNQAGSTAFALQFDASGSQPPVNIAVFDLTPKVWMRIACDVAGRPFSRVEWSKILPDRPYDPACR